MGVHKLQLVTSNETTLNSIASATTGATYGVKAGDGTFDRASFFAIVTAASGTDSDWTLTLNVIGDSGNVIPVAAADVDAESTGYVAFTKNALWTATDEPTPMPHQLVLAEDTSGGSLTCEIYAVIAPS
jgi:hypothetical protein